MVRDVLSTRTTFRPNIKNKNKKIYEMFLGSLFSKSTLDWNATKTRT